MNSITRVKKILSHDCADRVPRDFWSTAQTDRKLINELNSKIKNFEEILKLFKIDFRHIQGPKYIGPTLKNLPNGTFESIWGILFKNEYLNINNNIENVVNVINSPLNKLETLNDIKKYKHWPSPDWFDYSTIYEQCLKYGNEITVFMGDRLNRVSQFKTAIYLRGMDKFLLDMYLNKKIFSYIISRIIEFYNEYIKRILKAANGKIDIFMTGDDFGMQRNTIISVADWKKYFKPGFKHYIDTIHSFNIPVMHHSCGSIYNLIPEFIDCNLDILQSLQPNAEEMDFERIKKSFGNYICFHGGISIQTNLPFGKPKDVEEEVKKTMNVMKRNGGYIACTAHNIQADTPVSNILALIDAYDRYGKY